MHLALVSFFHVFFFVLLCFFDLFGKQENEHHARRKNSPRTKLRADLRGQTGVRTKACQLTCKIVSTLKLTSRLTGSYFHLRWSLLREAAYPPWSCVWEVWRHAQSESWVSRFSSLPSLPWSTLVYPNVLLRLPSVWKWPTHQYFTDMINFFFCQRITTESNVRFGHKSSHNLQAFLHLGHRRTKQTRSSEGDRPQK